METLSADPLLVALRDGGRCTADQLRAAEDIFARLGAEPAALADALNALGVLTRYQFRKVQLGRISEILFGQYLILEKIGEGGMGKVYRGVDTRMSRMVALKVIRPQLMSNKTVLKRYEREAEAAAKLDHPNIVKLFDAGEAAGRFYLAMEYVDGSDLSRLVKDNGPLGTAEACEYMRLVALGLQHAHESGFVHRDIKPSNLLVYGERAIPGTGGKARLKILDMGLVRNVADDGNPDHTELTRDGTVVGTPDYMSPEQAKNSSSVDGRADLYSLGCTLYYLLRGQTPYPDGTPIDKLIRHQLDPIPDVRQGRSDIPHAVGDIVTRLLRKKPDERYRSGAEVAALLAPHTPDAAAAAAVDLAPPPAGPVPSAVVYEAIDLTSAAPAPTARTSETPRSTPHTPPESGGRVVKATAAASGGSRPPAAKAKAIPKPLVVEPSSSESLPRPIETKRGSRAENTVPLSERVRKKKGRKRAKSFPTLTAAAVGFFAILLLVIGAVAVVRMGGTPATAAATETKKTPPTAPEPPPGKHPFRDIDTLLPDDTEAVLIFHAKPYWDRIAYEWRPASRQAKMVEFLAQRFHFDPRKFERGTVAFQADPTHVVAAGEGPWLTPDWLAGLDRARRMKVDAADGRGTQTVKFFEAGPAGRELSGTRGAILKGQAFVLADDRPALDSLVRRLKSGETPAEVDPLPLASAREAAKGTPFLSFSAGANFQLPTKPGARVDLLGTHGVDLLALSGRLERDFHFEVTLVGRDDKALRDFLGAILPDLLDARHGKLKPLADAIRKASGDAKVELDSLRGFRVKAAVIWKWEDVIAGLEAVIPPVLEKKD